MRKKRGATIKITGTAVIEIRDVKTQKLIKTVKCKNLIVNGGLTMHTKWAAGIAPASDPIYNVDTRIDRMAVGDDNTAPAKTQTALLGPLLEKDIYGTGQDANCGITIIDTDTVEFYMRIVTADGIDDETIREVGLFSKDSQAGDFMVSRFLCGNLLKTSSVQFDIKYRFNYS